METDSIEIEFTPVSEEEDSALNQDKPVHAPSDPFASPLNPSWFDDEES